MPHHAPAVRTVHPGRLDQLGGQRLDEVLAHEEHPEGAHQRGQDDGLQLVGPGQFGDEHVQRYDAELRRHHHRADHQQQQEVLEPEAQFGEGEAGEGGEEHGPRGDRARDDGGVEQSRTHVGVGPGDLQVLEEIAAEPEGRGSLRETGVVPGGRHRRPHQREQRADGEDDQDGMGDPAAVELASGTLGAQRFRHGRPPTHSCSDAGRAASSPRRSPTGSGTSPRRSPRPGPDAGSPSPARTDTGRGSGTGGRRRRSRPHRR